MQFNATALLLLSSIASVLAQTPVAEKRNVIDDINSGINEVLGVTTVVSNIVNGATSVIGDIVNGATSVAGDVEAYLSSVGNNLETVLPTITAIPSDVDAFFSSVENKVENLHIPTSAWNDIKTGLYPPQVSQWVDSLPTGLRAEASQKLTEWANDVSNTANSPNRGAVVLGAVGVAGVLAVAMAL